MKKIDGCNKGVLKIVRTTAAIVLFCAMLFFLYKMLTASNELNTAQTVSRFNKPGTLSGTELCYLNGEYIYTINTVTGTVQIFDKSGQFEKGLKLPTNGGTVWAGMSDKLYVYCIRTDLLVKVNATDYEREENVHYSNSNIFCSTHNLTNKNLLKLKGNVVRLTDGGEKRKIVLNADVDIFSVDVSMTLYGICLLAFMYVIGVFEKIEVKRGKDTSVLRRLNDRQLGRF